MNRARLLVNPAAGRGRHVEPLERASRRHGLECVTTSDPGQATEHARDAVQAGCSRLLVAGGDGTLHHVVRGLAGGPCALGIIPAGTGNDLATVLEAERDPERALERSLAATPRQIDLGRAAGRPFAGVAGIGIVGDVLRFLDERRQRLRGPWVYPWAVMRTLTSFRPPNITVEHEENQWSGPAMIAVAANSPRFGGGMRIAPQASLDDGRLDVVIVEALPKTTLLRLFPKVYSGRHLDHPSVRHFRAPAVTLAADRPVTVYADGEPLLELPEGGARIDAWPRSLGIAV